MAHTDWVITSQLSPCSFTPTRGGRSVKVEKLSGFYIYHKTHITTWSPTRWPPIRDWIGLCLTAVIGYWINGSAVHNQSTSKCLWTQTYMHVYTICTYLYLIYEVFVVNSVKVGWNLLSIYIITKSYKSYFTF